MVSDYLKIISILILSILIPANTITVSPAHLEHAENYIGTLEGTDIAIYGEMEEVTIGELVTIPNVGVGSIISQDKLTFTIEPSSYENIYKGISGSKVMSSFKVIGYVSRLTSDGYIECIKVFR